MPDANPEPLPIAIDLSQSFGPSWAREEDTKERLERLARQHGGGEEDRPRRSGGGGGRDHRDGGGRHAPGPSDRRPPRREGGGKPRGNDRRDSSRDRPERPRPDPELTGWEVRFTPVHSGVEGLARQIKSSGRSYPLFDLARLVLEKSERYSVEFRRQDEDAQALWKVKTDGTLWLSESEAIAHAVTATLGKFYRREQQAVEPPKGAVQIIGVCGMSGTLLGPPTHHEYQARVMRLHKERFSNLPLDVFKSRIRMERDEELIGKWREQESVREVFYPMSAERAKAEDQKDDAETPAPSEASAETPEDSAASPAGAEVAPTEVSEEVTASEPAPIDPSPTADEAAPLAEPEPAAETEAKTTATSEETPLTPSALEAHFREHHAAREVKSVRRDVTSPGPAALNDSAAPVITFTRRVLDDLLGFPLSTAQVLANQLTAQGLNVFKTPDRVTHLGVARPRFFDLNATPVSDSIRTMIEYLESHAATARPEQLKEMAALRPEEDAETAMLKDLRWLLYEGYVVDFLNSGYSVTPRPAARPEKKAKANSAAKPAAEAAVGPAVEPEPEAESTVEPAVESTES